jgi:hypothetical protein
MTHVPQLLEKLNLAERFFKKETSSVPKEISDMIEIQKGLLLEAKKMFGDNHISPFKFENYQVPESLTKPF